MFDGPAIRAFRGAFERRDCEPKNRPTGRIFVGNDFAIVMPHRLPRPTDALRLLRQIYIDQRKRFDRQQQLEHTHNVGFERYEIWFTTVAHIRAEREAARAQQCCLLRRRKRAGMPTGVAQV